MCTVRKAIKNVEAKVGVTKGGHNFGKKGNMAKLIPGVCEEAPVLANQFSVRYNFQLSHTSNFPLFVHMALSKDPHFLLLLSCSCLNMTCLQMSMNFS